MKEVDGIVGKYNFKDGKIPICDEDFGPLENFSREVLQSVYSESHLDYDDYISGVFVRMETGQVVGIRIDESIPESFPKSICEFKHIEEIRLSCADKWKDKSYIFPESFRDLQFLKRLKCYEDVKLKRFVIPECDPLPLLEEFIAPRVEEWIVPDWFRDRFLKDD